jgi:hypothetical protein
MLGAPDFAHAAAAELRLQAIFARDDAAFDPGLHGVNVSRRLGANKSS